MLSTKVSLVNLKINTDLLDGITTKFLKEASVFLSGETWMFLFLKPFGRALEEVCSIDVIGFLPWGPGEERFIRSVFGEKYFSK